PGLRAERPQQLCPDRAPASRHLISPTPVSVSRGQTSEKSQLIRVARGGAIAPVRALGYTGAHAETAGAGVCAIRRGCRKPNSFRELPRELPMSSTFDTVANIISETCDIPRDTIKPESHAIDDLGIDSLDFLDIAFAIDKAFGIKLPLEQ